MALTETAKSKIKSATKDSKIALFKSTRDHLPDVEVVFDSTVATRNRIKNNDINYLGSYYGRDGVEKASRDVGRYMRGY